MNEMYTLHLGHWFAQTFSDGGSEPEYTTLTWVPAGNVFAVQPGMTSLAFTQEHLIFGMVPTFVPEGRMLQQGLSVACISISDPRTPSVLAFNNFLTNGVGVQVGNPVGQMPVLQVKLAQPFDEVDDPIYLLPKYVRPRYLASYRQAYEYIKAHADEISDMAVWMPKQDAFCYYR